MSRLPTPSTPPLSAGRVVGDKYEIAGVLGEGGTGVVYDALTLPAREPVALKVIHNHLLTDSQIRGRFAREAAILRRLEGPHLSAMLEFGEVPDPRRPGMGLLYMALPKIDGPALDVLLKREGPLAIERALDVMQQILKGLKSAHMQGVIHRDLKPANVIMRGDAHAIVVDFGMAKIVTGGGTGTTALTTHNMVFGTPEYMSPEQARGDELDARCDVYAAGVMLYELLTGAVPFTGASALNVLTAHLTSTPERPTVRAKDRGISPALEAVVLHAIAKDPGERYASAAALSAALVHAASAPGDVASVSPQTFSPTGNADTDDAHATTIPAPVPTDRPGPPDPTTAPATGASVRPKQSEIATVPPAAPAGLGPRGWVVLVAVAVVSIGLGVLLSLLGLGN
jgi:eukaryotic-like serine/threonine-protein kinase